MDGAPFRQAETRRRVNAGLRRRYRSERLFQLAGVLSIVAGLGFLLFLFTTIIGNGYGAFRHAEIRLEIFFDAGVVDPDGRGDPQALAAADYAQLVRQAVQDAIVSLTRTIAAISANPPSPAASAALTTYFGATSPAVVTHYLRIILAHLPTATFECEYPSHVLYGHFCRQPHTAYVRAFLAMADLGNIHICQPAFDAEPPHTRMGTMVHEAAHRYAAAYLDKYYANNCAESTLTIGLSDLAKLHNADSYACLVETLG